jgi:hypothetical protein
LVVNLNLMSLIEGDWLKASWLPFPEHIVDDAFFLNNLGKHVLHNLAEHVVVNKVHHRLELFMVNF